MWRLLLLLLHVFVVAEFERDKQVKGFVESETASAMCLEQQESQRDANDKVNASSIRSKHLHQSRGVPKKRSSWGNYDTNNSSPPGKKLRIGSQLLNHIVSTLKELPLRSLEANSLDFLRDAWRKIQNCEWSQDQELAAFGVFGAYTRLMLKNFILPSILKHGSIQVLKDSQTKLHWIDSRMKWTKGRHENVRHLDSFVPPWQRIYTTSNVLRCVKT